MSNIPSYPTRDASIDIAKGIGIILMILGHCGLSVPCLQHFIYSFHMPLFFIISGMFYKHIEPINRIKKDISGLIKYYAVSCLAVVLTFIAIGMIKGDSYDAKYYLIASFVGSGHQHEKAILGNLPHIGAIWFLPAMFVCRCVYNSYGITSKNRKLIISTILFLFSLFLSKIIYIPFSVLPGISALIFFCIGDILRNQFRNSEFKKTAILVGIICYVCSFAFSQINMVCPILDYPLIDVIGASFMTGITLYVSKTFSLKPLSGILTFSGRYSLYILCFHFYETKCCLSLRFCAIIGNFNILVICRILIPLILTYLLIKLRERCNLRSLNDGKISA